MTEALTVVWVFVLVGYVALVVCNCVLVFDGWEDRQRRSGLAMLRGLLANEEIT